MIKLAPRQALPRTSLVDREPFIVESCTNKRVLHLGCAAWPFTSQLAETGSLLHQKLDVVCSALAGVDISEEGNALLRALGMKNIHTAVESQTGDFLAQLGWTPEVIVAGELIEHLDAPGPFLAEHRGYMTSDCILMITVPSAFSLKSLLHMVLGREKVNRDHVAYYSYMTMKQLLARHGLMIVGVACYFEPTENRVQKAIDSLMYPLVWARPYLSDGLILSCRIQPDGI